MSDTDLPDGYRWASEIEMSREDAIVVTRTVDSQGVPYTQGEADIAVPIRKSRPNKNYILQLMRDDDFSDPWGVGLSWGWACCENLAAIGSEVPHDIGYRPGAAGPEVIGAVLSDGSALTEEDVSYETARVQEYLDVVNVDVADYSEADHARVDEVEKAAVLISRYLDWCKLDGRDY